MIKSQSLDVSISSKIPSTKSSAKKLSKKEADEEEEEEETREQLADVIIRKTTEFSCYLKKYTGDKSWMTTVKEIRNSENIEKKLKNAASAISAWTEP